LVHDDDNNTNDSGDDGGVGTIHAVQWKGFLHVMGITLYSMEGVGLILSLQSSAKDQPTFPYLLQVVLAGITLFMAFFGTAGYLAFGDATLAPVTLNLPPHNVAARWVKSALCVGLYLTYPVMMFPIWNISDAYVLKQQQQQQQQQHGGTDGRADLRRQAQLSSFRSTGGQNLSIRNLFGGIRSSHGGNGGMSMKLKVRYSLRELEQMAEDGNPEPLERLVRAWQALLDKMTPQDLHEHFYTLSPLDIKNTDKLDTATALTGNHGNVLFPTWHRVYLVKLEQTLQQVSGDSAVTLPYWDETSIPSQKHGLPKTITRATFTFQDGTTINNPLRTTLLPKPEGATTITIEDQEPMAMAIETVASGSGDEAMANTDHTNTEHTEYFEAPQTEEDMEEVDQDVKKLNQNIVSWFTETTDTKDQHRNLINRYKKSLEAPNFMLFSNTTSQDSYNGNKADEHVVSLESVHNDVHLAVAGWNGRQQYQLVKPQPHEPTELATLLDPLFWMHLCFLDYCFWIWQKKNDLTNLSSKSRRVRRSILDKTDAGTTLPSMVEGDETKGDDEGPPQSMTNSSNNNNSNSNSNSNNTIPSSP